MRLHVEQDTAAPAAAEHCPVEEAIRTIGGKRRMLIIRLLLLNGGQRFNELLRSVEGLSGKVLSQNLRELTHSGIVLRRPRRGAPRQVEYALTAAGRELLPIYEALGAWRERLDALPAGDGPRPS